MRNKYSLFNFRVSCPLNMCQGGTHSMTWCLGRFSGYVSLGDLHTSNDFTSRGPESGDGGPGVSQHLDPRTLRREVCSRGPLRVRPPRVHCETLCGATRGENTEIEEG